MIGLRILWPLVAVAVALPGASARDVRRPMRACVAAGPWTTRADNHDLMAMRRSRTRLDFEYPRPLLGSDVRLADKETLVFYASVRTGRPGVLRGSYHLDGANSGFELQASPSGSAGTGTKVALRSNEDAAVSLPLGASPSGAWEVTIRTTATGATTGSLHAFRIC